MEMATMRTETTKGSCNELQFQYSLPTSSYAFKKYMTFNLSRLLLQFTENKMDLGSSVY